MSSYTRITKHPITQQFEQAEWIDNYFGHHKYGIKFSDGNVFAEEFYKWEFKGEI